MPTTKHLIYFTLLIITLSTSCQKVESPQIKTLSVQEQLQFDDSIISSYLIKHDIKATKDNNGVYYSITKEGNGEYPKSNSTVEVYYKGYLTNGSIFDETRNNSYSNSLTNLITGWQIGIPYISKGGSGTLFIPSHYGYGTRAIGSIPANSVLIFDIDLIDFNPN